MIMASHDGIERTAFCNFFILWKAQMSQRHDDFTAHLPQSCGTPAGICLKS